MIGDSLHLSRALGYQPRAIACRYLIRVFLGKIATDLGFPPLK